MVNITSLAKSSDTLNQSLPTLNEIIEAINIVLERIKIERILDIARKGIQEIENYERNVAPRWEESQQRVISLQIEFNQIFNQQIDITNSKK